MNLSVFNFLGIGALPMLMKLHYLDGMLWIVSLSFYLQNPIRSSTLNKGSSMPAIKRERTRGMVKKSIIEVVLRPSARITTWPQWERYFTVDLQTRGKKEKERKRIYIAPFIYYAYLKALKHASHSFTCKYTMPAFPSYAFTRWRHL